MSAKKKTILIKRYASRRLYNSDISEYVTLNEIADLIREGHDVQIVDKKTNEDLTRQYLLQIITDQEAEGEKAFPANILMEVIRAYKDQTQTLMPDFLSRSYEIFKEQQAIFFAEQSKMMEKATDAAKGAAKSAGPAQPADMLGAWQAKMNEWLGQGLTGGLGMGALGKNPAAEAMAAWQEQQQKFFKNALGQMSPKPSGSSKPAQDKTPPDAAAMSAKEEEIALMKAQIEALNKKLSEL